MNASNEKAMRLALEALEMYCEHGAILRPLETRDALKEALAKQEQPLPPVEIGVDVTSDGTSVVAFYRRPDAVMEMFYSQFHPLAVKQEQGEPVVGTKTWFEDGKVVTQNLYYSDVYTTPQQRHSFTYEQMKEQVEGLQRDYDLLLAEYNLLKQEHGEPVAWCRYEEGMLVYYETKAWDDLQPLYTKPQQRTWVGLTDDERLEAAEIDGADEWFWKVCKAIEAKLKEKNERLEKNT